MKVHELAKDMGLDIKTVLELTGKGNHLEKLSDEEAEKVRVAYKTGTIPVNRNGKARFWALVRNMKIVRNSTETISFYDYAFVCDEKSPDAADIRYAMKTNSDVFEVEDKPFQDEGDIANFRKVLQAVVFTGAMGEVSRDRGITCLRAIFWPDELAMSSGPSATAERLIERALKTKSIKKE
jgi:hypothetical protein